MNDRSWTEDAADVEENERQHLSEARTQMAEDRTVLANERTFASWLRTALAAVGIGLGFHALFFRIDPWWVPRLIATAFFLVAIYVIVSAERRACVVHDRLHAHKVEAERDSRLRAITIVTCLAVSALIATIWTLPI